MLRGYSLALLLYLSRLLPCAGVSCAFDNLCYATLFEVKMNRNLKNQRAVSLWCLEIHHFMVYSFVFFFFFFFVFFLKAR